MKGLLAALVTTTLAAAVPLYAHHSFARYYLEDRSVSIEGELFEFSLRSPHAWVYVMAEGPDGTMQLFAAEWSNANRLDRQGVTEDTLRPGDRVVVRGSPGRDPSEHKIHLKEIERLSDGWSWARGQDRR